MGLSIVLQDERGARVDGVLDPTNVLHRLLPTAGDTSSRCLRYVDWYGDTVFNRLQMGDVLDELQTLFRNARAGEEKELLGRIIDLANKCKREPHLYVKFSGD